MYPTFKTIVLSFQEWGFFESKWVGYENYSRLMNDWLYRIALRNTLTFSFWSVSLQLVETTALALLISRLAARAQRGFRAVFYLPGLAGGIVASVIWLWIFSPMGGLLNYLVGLIGIPPQLWLFDAKWTMFSIIFMSVATVNGVNLLLLLASTAGIPRSLYEAADLDGASALRQAVRITVPLIKPVLLYIAIMSTIGAMQMFEPAWILTTASTQSATAGAAGFSTLTLVYYIMAVAWLFPARFDIGYAAAQTVTLAAYLLLIAVVQFRYFGSNVEY